MPGKGCLFPIPIVGGFKLLVGALDYIPGSYLIPYFKGF
jgi:hypothetical protein